MQRNLSMLDSLVQLSFLVQAILNRVGADHDVSNIQIRLFGILRDRELSMLQLAQYLNLDKSSITGLIDRAERRGLVERINVKHDRRVIHVRMTPAGQQLVQLAVREIQQQINTVTEVLSENERSQFIALASKILGDFPK
ncbi:MarR family transcriptional regulator [Paenibacillus thalictri]|uniref:MarR family transcriptional regulator n=1 Tax=Paenibacillus thalictri TaxID=2527873 RepID=A0A4Q9DH91_9BACL|nr:MarR family transcriptional regulator [Paenibacillus thalictri]